MLSTESDGCNHGQGAKSDLGNIRWVSELMVMHVEPDGCVLEKMTLRKRLVATLV